MQNAPACAGRWTSSDRPKINLSGKPAGNGAGIIRRAATKYALFLRYPSTQQ